jgi:hypothetical protein
MLLVRTAGRRWPRLDSYLTYLRISRQRHPVRWWYEIAGRADLLDVRLPSDSAERSPLNLLTFQRADDSGESS